MTSITYINSERSPLDCFATYTDQEGTIFYIFKPTGEAGISIRGLARLCGVTQGAIQYLVREGTKKNSPKPLKGFPDNGSIFLGGTKGMLIPIENAKPLSEIFCISVITHYARKGNITAQETQDKLMISTFRQWVHSKVNPNHNSQLETITAEVVSSTKKEVVEEIELLQEAEKIRKKIREKESETEKLKDKLSKINTVIKLIQELDLE